MKHLTVDGNEAVAMVAHKLSEVIAIYPITPSSGMAELSDLWSSQGKKNLWGSIPLVQEMQSEGGAAGVVHGSLQTGSLTTTFTASQGLLLMIPNMYKIAGELTSTVFHIAARSVAAQALSIFGDHSDVMTTRSTGWAMLFGNSVQEAHDFAAIAQAATLKARVPFLNIMDGFRTSHEVMKIEPLNDEVLHKLIDDDLIRAHRQRALSPDHPFIRGTAQNPDVFFQAREASNPYYERVPDIVQDTMQQFSTLTGRSYHLFDFAGAPDAERIIVIMGSGAETVEETVKYLLSKGEKVGVIKVRLYRPFATESFLKTLPQSVKTIAVLDRSKEPGSIGEPLYQDIVNTVFANRNLNVIGGRYGLSSKEFTPAMVMAIFDEMKKDHPKPHFTIGIHDDVTNLSLEYDPHLDIESDDMVRAVFWGLGSDGTVGANRNSIKIIGEETDLYAQGYFVMDSKKSGARTISHLRFGHHPIQSTYLIQRASFVAVHQFGFLERYDMLTNVQEGATFLLNSPYDEKEVWAKLPRNVQQQIIDKRLEFYVVNAYDLAAELGLGQRVNTVMQTCFFALSKVLPKAQAIEKLKAATRKAYGKRGEVIVRMNEAAIDTALSHLYKVEVPSHATSTLEIPPVVPAHAPAFVQNISAVMMAEKGDALPVSALPADGTFPSGTTQWEKRNIAQEIPVWDPEVCIQCGKCVLVCPHSVIRAKIVDRTALAKAPEGFLTHNAMWKGLEDKEYTLQVAVEDCTGCSLCVEVCPAKNKTQTKRKAINMQAQRPLRERGKKHWEFFLSLPDYPRYDSLPFNNVKNVQLLLPLFEFSGACAGCGETPYLKLLSQLFGDRSMIANATGCSSIYGGNLPTTPWTVNKDGHGPSWSNSLFEDNAEFGLGMRLALDTQLEYAHRLLNELRDTIGPVAEALLQADQSSETGIAAQRERVSQLKTKLQKASSSKEKDLLNLADVLVKKTVWLVGGDGWAYDIGYGGLDHVLASGRNINILVLDTEVYSNTGGQSSKATSMGAIAKFAAAGKRSMKKDLGMMAMAYGNVYVAQVAMGANDAQTIKAFLEAESYDGPSIIIAYSHCIAHGIDMAKGMEQQKLAAESAYWPLYRYDPRLKAQGKNPFQLDSRTPKISFKTYALNENRYRMLMQVSPKEAERLLAQAQQSINERWQNYERLAAMRAAATAEVNESSGILPNRHS